MNREEILEAAEKNICGRREQDYGSPENNFGIIANLWTVWLCTPVTPVDVAVMMGMMKMARVKGNPAYADNWIDLAGYAACGGEIGGGMSEEVPPHPSLRDTFPSRGRLGVPNFTDEYLKQFPKCENHWGQPYLEKEGGEE